jgi:hypothetical protein
MNEKYNFIENLPKIYATYTGGFIAFILLMAVFEQLGMSADTIGILFVAFTIAIYAFIQRRRTGCPAPRSWRWPAASISVAMAIWPSWLAGPVAMCW